MIYQGGKTVNLLLGATALATLMIMGVGPGQSQQIEMLGDSYSYTGGCDSVKNIPACSPTFTALGDQIVSGNTWFQPGYSNIFTGIVIGSHATNSLNNLGPLATGFIQASEGIRVESNLVYVGYENNTEGQLIIKGPDTHWRTYGGVSVGHYGNGHLSVLDGATLDITYDPYVYAGYGNGSTGEIIVSGTNGMSRSSILTGNRVYLGYNGDASLSITDGGYFRAMYTSYAGYAANSTTTFNISGVGQLSDGSYVSSLYEVVNNYQNIGSSGKGYANVKDGGSISVQRSLTMGEFAGGLGVLNVDGVNQPSGIRSTVSAGEGLYISEYGTGYLNITNGGLVITNSPAFTNFVDIGAYANSMGTVNVDGVGGDLSYQSTLSAKVVAVGKAGSGILNITNGGLTTASGQLEIGSAATGVGVVNVLGADHLSGHSSQALIDGGIVVGVYGNGTLNIGDGGTVDAIDDITVAKYTNSTGVVNIGIGAQAGSLNAAVITGGAGDATVNFNHTDDIDFSTQLRGSMTVDKLNGGVTTLITANDYIGTTTAIGGSLRAGVSGAFSSNSDHVVTSAGTLDMNGFDQTVLSLNNSGAVKLGGAPGATLTVTNDYVGNDGIVYFNTALNGDASETDLLVIEGNSTGSSKVHVTNMGGLGAQTVDGIKIIDVVNASTSDGTFNLLGDYVHEGKQAVVGGAYAYKLYQGTTSTPTDGDWYLRSQLKPTDPVDPVDPTPPKPLYQAGVPIYEAYPQALLGLNGLNTLQERVGNRFWAGAGNKIISQGADAVQPYAAPEESGVHIDGNGVWGRIEGAHNKIKPRSSTSETDYNQNVFKVQAGIDGLLNETENGTLIGGVFVQYVHGKTKVNSVYGDGDISTDGYGVGGTLTWYGNEGLYIDGQAHVTWYRSDLSSDLANTGLADGNKGLGYAFSAEAGKRFAIDPEWSVTPQAQLVYSRIDFDSFTDPFGAAVSLDKGDSLQGRLGFTLDHETSWQNANGMTDRAHVYGIANLYYEFLKGTLVDVAGTGFASEKERLWGGIGLGGSYNWNDDKYSLYGEGIVNTSLNNFGDSHSLKGNVGFRVKW